METRRLFETWNGKNGQTYLVKVGPESADGQFCPVPCAGWVPRHIPDRVPQRPVIHLHIDAEQPRGRVTLAGYKVVEINTVGVIFLKLRQE